MAFLPGVDVDFVYKLAVRAAGALQIARRNRNGMANLVARGQRSVRRALSQVLRTARWGSRQRGYEEQKQ